MPDRITVNNLIPALRDLGFLILVIIVDIAVILSTIYMEANGAKLALPNLKWPKEISALLELLGVPANYLTPPVLFGFGTSILMFAGTFLIVRYLIGTIGTAQRFFINRRRDELSSLFQPLIIAIIMALLLYGGLFRLIMMKWAQLQLAKTLWPMDFQPVLKGDTIQVIQQGIPDMSVILKKHEGEFLKSVVTNFPFALLIMHLIASLLTEVFFLYTMTNLGNFESRIDEIISRIRGRLLAPFHRRFRHRHQETTPVDSSGIPSLEKGNRGSEDNPTDAETHEQETESETPSPADQPVRVIGGGDIITPNIARQYPELYVVEERHDPETGEVLYFIYTREFHEKMNNHVEVLIR
ncbi:MAG: hypothetical protein QW561_02500 [Candidatus Aenigmatarchaeota archaeon]